MNSSEQDEYTQFFKKVKAWSFKGRRKYITMVVLLIVVPFPWVYNVYSSISTEIKGVDKTAPNKSTTPCLMLEGEQDVMNEWVAAVWTYSSEIKAEEALRKIETEYLKLGHNSFKNSIHVVRGLEHVDSYTVVIDIGRGSASQQIVSKGIAELQHFSYQHSRSTGSALGQLIDKAKPIFYDGSVYSSMYACIEP